MTQALEPCSTQKPSLTLNNPEPLDTPALSLTYKAARTALRTTPAVSPYTM